MPRDEKPSDTEKGKLQIQYFLIQVSKCGSESILRDGFYQHENWMDTHHDADYGNVRIGDILIIYFASNSIKFPQQIKKVIELVQYQKITLNRLYMILLFWFHCILLPTLVSQKYMGGCY